MLGAIKMYGREGGGLNIIVCYSVYSTINIGLSGGKKYENG